MWSQMFRLEFGEHAKIELYYMRICPNIWIFKLRMPSCILQENLRTLIDISPTHHHQSVKQGIVKCFSDLPYRSNMSLLKVGNYTIFQMFENPRRSRQARNFTTNVPKILDLKSSSEKIFSEN